MNHMLSPNNPPIMEDEGPVELQPAVWTKYYPSRMNHQPRLMYPLRASIDYDGLRHLSVEDWDEEALLILMRIICGRNRLVPRVIDLERPTKITVLIAQQASTMPCIQDWLNSALANALFVYSMKQRVPGSNPMHTSLVEPMAVGNDILKGVVAYHIHS
ncbi:hypothetical protein F5Y19DRAFT_429372 [Xylariaceae sp. FL1651]|nr:hypothetical protein F5Y19DRAFT_429372 [Xylariaceae sp. FL1651]